MLWIRADAPTGIPNHFSIRDGFRDEAEKSHEARNWALFGKFQTSPYDDFQFWRMQSPVWVYPLALYFRILGAGYLQLRLFSVFCSVLGLFFLSWWAYQRWGPAASALVLTGLGLNYYFLVYSRIGLIEGMMNAWMAIAVYCFILSRERRWYFLIASLLYLGSVFSKQSTLFFMPAFLGLAAYLIWLSRKDGFKNHLPVLIGLVLVLGLVAYAISNPEYRMRTLYNVRHGLQYHRSLSPLLMRFDPGFTLQNIFSSFAPGMLWRGLIQLHFALTVLGVVEIALIGWMLLKKRGLDFELVLILAWFILARLSAVISPHRVVRFYLAEFYPLALLSAALIGRTDWKKGRKILVAVALCLELGGSGYYYWDWMAHRQYQLYDNALKLARILEGKPAVMIGEWAGPFTMESRAVYYYVKRGFNESPVQLANFRINYLLETIEPADAEVSVGPYRKFFPAKYLDRRELWEFRLYRNRIKLYQVPR